MVLWIMAACRLRRGRLAYYPEELIAVTNLSEAEFMQ